MHAETREQAREAVTRFATEYGAKYPNAVTTLEKDTDVLLTFRLPRRILEAPQDLERDRVSVRDGPTAPARDEGRRVADQGPLDRLQAPRHGAGPVASPRRRTSPPTRASWHRLRGRRPAGRKGQQGEGESSVISAQRAGSLAHPRDSKPLGRAEDGRLAEHLIGFDTGGPNRVNHARGGRVDTVRVPLEHSELGILSCQVLACVVRSPALSISLKATTFRDRCRAVGTARGAESLLTTYTPAQLHSGSRWRA